VRPSRPVVVAAAVAALLSGVARPTRGDGLSDLEKAHSAYVAHQYDDAETRLRALLDPQNAALKDPDSIADARMYLGAVLVAEGKKDQAGGVFEQLLVDRPDYQPDPLRVSLEAIDAIIDARSRLRDKLAAIQAEKVRKSQEQKAKVEQETRRAALHLAMLEKLAATEVVTERNSRLVALLPFGVGQFQNRQDTWGIVLLSVESALVLGSFAGAGFSLYDQQQANDEINRTKTITNTARAYQHNAITAANVGDGFAVGFFFLAVIGIAHAELTFVPDRTTVRKRQIPAVSLAPMVGPTGVGVSGRF